MDDHLPPDALPSVRLAGPAEADRVPENMRIGGNIPTWDTATRRFSALVGHFEQHENSHRALNYDAYTESWARSVWGLFYGLDRKACEWAEQTILIVFTGSPYFDRNSEIFIPPVTFYKQFRTAAEARQKALSRALSDVQQWRSIRVVGSRSMGYPVLFLGLYLSTSVESQVFEPILAAHVNNCQIAEHDAHDSARAITIKNGPTHPSELIHGLGKQIPGLESNAGILEEPWTRRATATVLRAGQWRSYTTGASI
jgi:hypothetical protein